MQVDIGPPKQRAVLTRMPQQAPACWRRWRWGTATNPDPAVAAGHLDRAEALAATTGDPDVVADVLVGRLITYSGVATLSKQTLEWSDQLNALRHSRFRKDGIIADSASTMAAMNLGDVAGAERRLRAGIEGSEELRLPVLRGIVKRCGCRLP